MWTKASVYLLLASGIAVAQSPAPAMAADSSRLRFDVASIRPAAPDQNFGGIKPMPNGTG